jgi:hypothetical protein
MEASFPILGTGYDSELCSHFVDVLSASFDALSNCLSSHDGFLFLLEPLYFLLDPGQLLLHCGFIFFRFLILVLHLDLVKLGVALKYL